MISAINKPRIPELARQIGGGKAKYMPIRLKQILGAYGIPQTEWCQAIIQEGGRCRGQGLSQPMGSLILNWGTWPKLTATQSIKNQTIAFLRQRGVSEDHLGGPLWSEVDGQDYVRQTTPRRKPQVATPEAFSTTDNEDEESLPEKEMLSQQAKRHFKLFQDPFLDDIQGPDDVFLDDEQRYIREVMYQAASRSGFLAVIGESGAGKTTLRKDLVERIIREQLPITLIQPRIIDKGRLTAGAICDAIIQDVSQDMPRRTLEAKARQIEQLLSGSSRAGNSHVLIIEEAHDLSVSTLKYLKRFWELEDGYKRLMGIILIGQPELKYHLDERTNWEAREVIRRCEIAELRPLDNNLEAYLELKFKRLGKQLSDVFEADAADALRARLVQRRHGTAQVLSMLYPLVVNNTVRKAMNLATEIGVQKVNAEIIRGI